MRSANLHLQWLLVEDLTLSYKTDVGQVQGHDASPCHLAPGGTCLALSAALHYTPSTIL